MPRPHSARFELRPARPPNAPLASKSLDRGAHDLAAEPFADRHAGHLRRGDLRALTRDAHRHDSLPTQLVRQLRARMAPPQKDAHRQHEREQTDSPHERPPA